MKKPARINDCHIHMGLSGPWSPDFDPSVTVEDVMVVMKENNVKKAVVFPNPLPGSKYPKANDYIISCAREFPDRLIGFGRIDHRYGREIFPEIKRLASSGIKGIKLHPIVECFRPDHPYFFQVYDCIVKSNIKFVITHTDSHNSLASAKYWSVIAKKFTKLNIVLAHLNKTCIPLLKEFSNIYVETSASSISFIEEACAIDSSRVMFGSDYPYQDYKRELAKVMNSRLSMREKEKVLYKNFDRIFSD